MASAYTRERRSLLQDLAEALPRHGLAGRIVGGDDPMLQVWHPETGRQTLVFATPSREGWLFLWAQGGRGDADDLERTAHELKETLDSA
ncbi:hypothetical protein OUY22_21110 [Nonomuraea sp. MCN248]|uniref:SsgA family sporulation/cell division regulator n=1 Tax=Nonomuraea corallina TaxID=2989783 RepID=A0ABT4SFJ1_9ACTN|nr:hypothetical protein [Nonomuraea corallina]MDA0635929.1 hypothetical protein [Nonomuraea corallina]